MGQCCVENNKNVGNSNHYYNLPYRKYDNNLHNKNNYNYNKFDNNNIKTNKCHSDSSSNII